MDCFDWQTHVKQIEKSDLNLIHMTVKSGVFPCLYR